MVEMAFLVFVSYITIILYFIRQTLFQGFETLFSDYPNVATQCIGLIPI